MATEPEEETDDQVAPESGAAEQIPGGGSDGEPIASESPPNDTMLPERSQPSAAVAALDAHEAEGVDDDDPRQGRRRHLDEFAQQVSNVAQSAAIPPVAVSAPPPPPPYIGTTLPPPPQQTAPTPGPFLPVAAAIAIAILAMLVGIVLPRSNVFCAIASDDPHLCPREARYTIGDLRRDVRRNQEELSNEREELHNARAQIERLGRLRTEGTIDFGVPISTYVESRADNVRDTRLDRSLPGFWTQDGEWASLRVRLQANRRYSVRLQASYNVPEPAYQVLRVSGYSLVGIDQGRDSSPSRDYVWSFAAPTDGIYIIRVGSGASWSGPITVTVSTTF